MEIELRKELGPGHSLYGRKVSAIAMSEDDILFALIDDSKVAEVHLTWVGHQESPPWPIATEFRCLTEWLEDVRSR
jgi:hypothetical protein